MRPKSKMRPPKGRNLRKINHWLTPIFRSRITSRTTPPTITARLTTFITGLSGPKTVTVNTTAAIIPALPKKYCSLSIPGKLSSRPNSSIAQFYHHVQASKRFSADRPFTLNKTGRIIQLRKTVSFARLFHMHNRASVTTRLVLSLFFASALAVTATAQNDEIKVPDEVKYLLKSERLRSD